MAYDIMPEFQLPSFLHDQSAETIHQKMMGRLPDDLDDTPGGWPWDLIKPTALEKAELLEFYLPETIKMMFYMWASDTWLDHHARVVNLERRAANPASGPLLVEGKSGTIIPEGFAFATAAVGDSASIVFRSMEEYTIGPSGTAIVRVAADDAGQIGNVPTDTIALMVQPMRDITAVSNPEPITGGVEEEDDESLRLRINEKYKHIDETYIGNDWDYIRWAKEVSGVGEVVVIPIPYGPGSVKVVVIDANGVPANQMILDNVYNYIVSPGDRLARKAPIEATVYVVAPSPKNISYCFLLVLEEGAIFDEVIAAFSNSLAAYYVEAIEERIIRYNRVSSILTQTPGVKDFTSLTINETVENICFEQDEYPVTEAINAAVPEVVSLNG